MTCCAESGYCSLIEVYLGASDEAKNAKTPADQETAKEKAKGVAQKSAIRNITKALDGQPGKRLIVADNFYSSYALAIALLERERILLRRNTPKLSSRLDSRLYG
ncbi:Hypothetical protein PHPALM_18526 [Phytophthora palmivora]|uniref:PiggyBac transposable element-derived protein domain-containing protein n=1 Tax=Phytophthora palmivora TaxID=4796 RepID=A0A2P4XJI3_9STRA|nr:Hypothetical protein PHPALM_18526 [Phytophthora palmivora]